MERSAGAAAKEIQTNPIRSPALNRLNTRKTEESERMSGRCVRDSDDV
jgi:hypothetical protein